MKSKPIRNFLKKYCLKILVIESFVLCASLAGYSFTPFIRAINKNWGIVFAVLFVIFAVGSFVMVFLLFNRYDNVEENSKYKNTVRFFFYVSSLIVNGIIITAINLIIRAITPNTQYLVQGLTSILALIFYYLLFGIIIYSNPLINFVFKTKK